MPAEPIEAPSLEAFRDDNLIVGVLGPVKSGKEATVYCCEAHRSLGVELLAAKVYRPLAWRSFRNDAVYQEGRVIRDARLRRAYRKKTPTGREVQSDLWVGREFEALRVLHEAGANVPRPVARSGPAILMEYVGNTEAPAPLLKSVRLEPDEAKHLFKLVMWNVEVFLGCNLVHADLSAFNILYWRGELKIIDFPQTVDPRFNPNALELLARDIRNVCHHFVRYGIEASAEQCAQRLWCQYLTGVPE